MNTAIGVATTVASLLVASNLYPRNPPYNQAFATIMFNATLPVNDFVISGEDFYRNKLRWNDTQMMIFKQKAMAYFLTKFGFVNPEANPSLYTLLYATNPEANTRCVSLTGETNMPNNGYPLFDAGWMITVLNPAGITLGGEFAGVHVPVGTTFAIGHWLIERPTTNILWEYQHKAPGIIATTGQGRTSHGEMKITSDVWGSNGLSLQVTKYDIFNRNNTAIAKALFRNIVTF